jgi:hypothetical protein
MLDNIIALATFMIAIGAAAERFVTIFKAIIPWLNEEQKTSMETTDPKADSSRRKVVLLLAYIGAWLTASFLTESSGLNPMGYVKIGLLNIPASVVAFLSMGGSAFWSSILKYASAVKDIKINQNADAALENRKKAAEFGITR